MKSGVTGHPQDPDEHSRFEALLVDLSTRFINLPPDGVDREIETALRGICELLGIDLGVLWQWSGPAGGDLTPTHYYTRAGLQPPGPLRRDQFPWYVQNMLAGRVVAVSSLEEFPAEAAVDREVCRLLGVKSNLTLPLSVWGEPPVGALGLNSTGAERDWPEALVRRIQVVAEVFTNALARRRHELDLRDSEERLSVAADAAEAGLWTLDSGTGVFWATERARALFGYGLDEPITLKRFEASVHPDDWKLVQGAIERSARTGEPLDVEYRIILPEDGSMRWIASRGRPRFTSSGEPDRLTGVSIDVTDRRRKDETLRVSEARLASGAELAGLGFYEVDFDAGTAWADDRMRALCGMPPGHEQNLHLLQFWLAHLHPDDSPAVLAERVRLHEGRVERLSSEYRYLHPTGGQTWLHHLGMVALRDASGRAVRSFGAIRDITAQKDAESALRQSLAEIELLKDRLQAERDYLKAEIGVTHAHGELTGGSPAIVKVLRQVEQVAPTDSTVLLQGETGTGKELVAQAIHRLSPRAMRTMVKINCGALPSGLIESELFGRERGAFTGALTRQAGRFEVADSSTLFLDEIGELSLDLQTKLLRVLETGEFERLGSSRTLKVNVRLVAATNRELPEAIKEGRFREDLYYRLNVFPIRVPPLRERADDIPPLVWAFVKELNARFGKKISQVPRSTMEALQRCPWPGNVRELRNVIEHAAIITTGDTLRVPALDTSTPLASPPQTLAEAERQYIAGALERTGWRVDGPKGAAAVLGLNASTLRSRMKKLGIRPTWQADRDKA